MPALEEIFRRIKEKGPLLLVDMTKRKNGETLKDIAPALQYADCLLYTSIGSSSNRFCAPWAMSMAR